MAMSWSTTKGITSTVLHMLADRGALDYDTPVATYWPEFAANGKGAVTIRQFMAMEAGLYDVRHLIDDPLDLLDHDTMAGHLAATRPCHEPGRASAYHTFTYGWIAGELVRRVTGSTLGAFAQSEIAEPLGLDGCFIGTPAAEFHRVAARPVLGPEPGLARGVAKVIDPLTRLVGFSPARIAAAFLPRGGGAVIPTTEFLAAEVPAVNGVFTAALTGARLCGARVGRRRRRCAAVVGRNPPARNRAAAAPPRSGRPDPDALAPRLPPALSVEAHLTIGVRLLRSVRVRRLRRPAPAARRRVRRPARQGTSAPQAGAIDQRRRRQPVITHRPVECGSISSMAIEIRRAVSPCCENRRERRLTPAARPRPAARSTARTWVLDPERMWMRRHPEGWFDGFRDR